MADVNVTYSEMDRMASVLSEARSDILDLLTALKTQVDTMLGEDFKTQHASGKFGDGYAELTRSLKDAVEGIEDMSTSLRRMMDAIVDLDVKLAGG